MTDVTELEELRQRRAPLEMPPGEFREIGHRLVDQVADRLARVPAGPVTRDESPAEIRRAFGAERTLPPGGTDAGRAARGSHRVAVRSLACSTGTRGFSATSPRARRRSACSATSWRRRSIRTWARGAWRRSPPRSRRQTVRWIAELIGFPDGCGGLLVSGGNMANFVGLLAARAAKATWNIAARRAVARRTTAPGLRVDGNAHLAAEGRRPVRTRHRRDPLDRDRRRAADGHLRAAPPRSSRISASAISHFSSSARPAR